MLKKIVLWLKLFGIATVSVIGGWFLLMLIYLLPVEPMQDNIARSSELFDIEGIYPAWAKGYKMTQLDNWTEGYLLCSAIYPSENPMVDALNVPIIEYTEKPITLSLTLQANGVDGETYVRGYGRYWHGMLLLIKPLLLFFDVADIRIFNMIVQMALIILIAVRIAQRGCMKMLLAFFMALMVINPITLPMSFTFSAEYLLMLCACLIVLHMHDKLKSGNRYLFFFYVLGILTVYFCELSFPLVTLGLPLLFVLLLDQDTWIEKTKNEIIYSVLWALGYALMWLGKWIIASLMTGKNYFDEVFNQASGYVTTGTGDPTVFGRIWKNISVVAKWPYLILIIIMIVFLIIHQYKKLKIESKSIDIRGVLLSKIPVLILIAYPFVFYAVMGNGYSYVHYWFSYRQLSITLAAGISLFFIEENCIKESIQ